MATTVDFKTRFPEFDSVADARVQLFLDDAALLMSSQGKWLSFYDIAHQYYAAHFLIAAQFTERGDSGIIAPVSHKEVDDVVIKKAISESIPRADELLSTAYGKRYWHYRKICLNGPRGV